MTTYSFATLFSGGGLADLGMMAAGWTPLWAVECEPAIVDVYKANIHGCVLVADVRDVDWRRLERPDHLHASPVCKNASLAKAGGYETAWDRECAAAVCRAIETLRPRTFTLENVYGYRRFEAYKMICAALDRAAYWWTHSHENSADHGVPQTRKRLILRATLGDWLRPLPALVPWRGWYEAIEDLIPTLPESRFAEWQLQRLPSELTSTFLHMTSNTQKDHPTGTGVLYPEAPANTVTSSDGARPRAFLAAPNGNTESWGDSWRGGDEPSHTVATNSGGRTRAFLVDGKPTDYDGNLRLSLAEQPTPTISASITKHPTRAWLEQGRVVAMTPRCLARFQSVPDDYELPENRRLACTVIGNGVPPLLAQRIAESLT